MTRISRAQLLSASRGGDLLLTSAGVCRALQQLVAAIQCAMEDPTLACSLIDPERLPGLLRQFGGRAGVRDAWMAASGINAVTLTMVRELC